MDTNTQTGAEGVQGQGQDNGLGNAMDGWGAGDNAAQTQQMQTQTQDQGQGQGQGEQQTQQGQTQHGQTQQSSTTTAARTPVTPPPAVDTAALIRAAVDSTAQALRQHTTSAIAQTQAQAPMSDDDFNRHYGITKVDAKALERLFDKDPAAGAAFLNEILDRNRTASLRMAKDLMEAQIAQQLTAFQPRLSVVERFIAEQHEARASERFYSSHPDLAAERDLVKEVLDATQAKIARKELTFSDEKTAFSYIADATKKVLSRMTPAQGTNGTLGSSSSQRGQQTQTGQRTMAAATSSARPGGQSSRASEQDTMMAQWDHQAD